jgi:hypothetical protein
MLKVQYFTARIQGRELQLFNKILQTEDDMVQSIPNAQKAFRYRYEVRTN